MVKKLGLDVDPDVSLDRKNKMAAAIKAHIAESAAKQARDKAQADAFEKAEAAREA